jgi:hypothetical protein
MFKGVINFDIPGWIQAYGSNFPKYGTLVWANPSFINPVNYLTDDGTTGAFLQGSLEGSNKNVYTGLRPTNDHMDDDDTVQNIMTLGAEYKNLLCPLAIDVDPGMISYQFKNYDPDGIVFYGWSFYPADSGAFGLTITTDYDAADFPDGLEVDVVQAVGVVGQFFDFKKGSFTVNPTMPVAGCNGDEMIGIRLKMTDELFASIGRVNVLSIKIECSCHESIPSLIWKTLNIPNFTQAMEIYEKYRVIAMNMLTTNMTNAMDSGGVVAACGNTGKPILYDGANPGQLWKYNGISEARKGFNGKFLDGLYSYWLPTANDFVFKSMATTDKPMSNHLIHYTNCVPALTTTVFGRVRVQVVIGYECTTTATFVESTVKPRINAMGLVQKMIADAKVPQHMQNDWHDWILRQLNNVTDVVEKGVPLVQRIIKSGAPLVPELMPLMAFL